MKKIAACFFLILIAFAAVYLAQARDAIAEAELLTNEKEYLSALIKADEGSLERLLSDTFSAGSDTKKQFIDESISPAVKFLTYETSNVRVVLALDTATITGNLESIRFHHLYGEYTAIGAFSRTWVRESGVWKLKTSKVDAPATWPKTRTSAEIERLNKELKPKKVLEIEYDKFKNISLVSTKTFNLVSGVESFVANTAVGMSQKSGDYSRKDIVTDLYCWVGFAFDGSVLNGVPQKYILAFSNSASDWQFLQGDSTLYWIIDDRRLQIEPVNKHTDVAGNSSSGVRTLERLDYFVSLADLKEIAAAKSAELRLGSTKPRKLKREHQDRIRNLLISANALPKTAVMN